MREWSKSLYENSASSRCWWFTPYDDGWDGSVKHGPDLREDKELRAIVEMEAGLDPLPEWARKIAETSIHSIPPCGHYTFPKAYLETVDAIGRRQPQSFLHTCFTVDSKRKLQMADYCLCLDAWLAGASANAPATELKALGFRKIDWLSVCQALWTALGDHTELKDLLVERTLIQTRWWIKSSVWEDDLAVRFGRDQYLGDFAESGCFATNNGNPNLCAPAFRLDALPRVQKIEARLKEICPDWPWFRNLIVEGSWPCAPKTFRYLERLLWSIGKERPAVSLPSFPLQNGDVVPDFLQAADTCPAPKQAAQWWQEFLKALSAWWQDKPASGSVAKDIATRLGDHDNVKRWLVRLYAYRLTILARHGATIGKLVKHSVEQSATSGLILCGTLRSYAADERRRVNPNSRRNWGTKELETG